MGIIITGASGQFGRMAADKMLQVTAPADLMLVTRNPDQLADYAPKGCDVRDGDFDDPRARVGPA